uniref:Uncharacterized protein n=1 Tax=Fagus sylvatica TaxID=28930 RepID=A0A2N9ES18_FAGSY
MEGDHHHEGTSNDPPMTPIERQMQVIATSIQDLARETSRQNKELWQSIKKGPPTPHDDNQHPPRGENSLSTNEARQRQIAPHGCTTRGIHRGQGLPSRHHNLTDYGRHSPKDSLQNCRLPRRQLPLSIQCNHQDDRLSTRLRAVTSTYHLLLKFPTEHRIGEVRRDQVAARKCYLASLGSEGQNQTMTIEEQKILVKPSEELDTIKLEDKHPVRTTRIGASLPPRMKESLIQFLKSNKDVLAWSHEDMPVIDPSIISHKLNEVDKLLTANFIREVFYPDWLANVVMVKKNTGKWRMCIDFTDLNKACPKDSFPLPRIDQLVDSTAGHKILTFMDAFSGYNQIVMDESDQEKTSFITSRGLFCYKVMPFRLKNSKEEGDHFDDLRETFETLRKYQMKLNPSKCAFGVYSGKFLGFMVSQRGIEANPDKIKAILEMQPPKTTKEIQRLTERVAALNRFISQSTDKCLPFFKTLKKAFTWTNECQQAFEKLKRYLTTPPLLSPSKQRKELYVYLTVSPTAAMHKPDAARRLIQWSVELSEFDINYLSWSAIKAQALADFIAEFTNKDDKQAETVENKTPRWTIHTDDSSTKNAKGVGIIIRSPEGDVIKRAIRLQYTTTNNEAEYEALLVGLKATKTLGATELNVHSDSQLVVGQVNGDYKAKEGRMLQYLNLVQHQMSKFHEVKLTRIPREQNTVVDQLARSMSSNELNDEIEVEYAGTIQAPDLWPRRSSEQGYYWPSIQADANVLVRHYDKCQRFANLLHSPSEELTPMTSPWPFAQWGLDIMGPLPIGRRQLRTSYGRPMICRFGIPIVLVSNNGKQFDNPKFRQFSEELGIHNHYSSPGHPQANGQVEVTNRSLLKLIKTRLERAKGVWPEKLPSILWAYRTTVQIPTGETPFRMTFGTEAVILVEIGMTTFRTAMHNDQQNDAQIRLNLDLIDEVRGQAEERMKRYQEKMTRHHNTKVKARRFGVGDLVLRKVTLATRDPTQGKLGPNWEGPYRVIEIHRRGTYHLEAMDGRRLPHPWNIEHLKKYYP